MLPKMDGFDVCSELRRAGISTPIIMLTARTHEAEKELGLDSGADDYVTKPFSLRELLARVKAVFRRIEERGKGLATYSFGEISLDFQKYEATKKGKKLDLTPLEFRMLKLLIEKGVKSSPGMISGSLFWGEDNVSVSFRTVDSHIANIRKKIEALGCYQTQKHRAYLSGDFIRGLALTRGVQIEEKYAEASR
jgi:two-component system alkaline phosphatase synthesis response regulator PhoP